MSKHRRGTASSTRGLLVVLMGGALVAATALGAGEWHLRRQARMIAEATADRAAQALRQADNLSIARALQEAAVRARSLESAAVVAPDGEIVASLDTSRLTARGLPRLKISVPVPPDGQSALAWLETTHSRTFLVTMALLVGAIATVLIGVVRILLAKRTFGQRPATHSNETPARQATQPRDGRPLDGMRVLIADDSEISRRLLSLYVTRHGGQTDEASDGQQAIERAASVSGGYDCIVLDLRMPRVDGADAALRLRQQHPRTPIIAVTAQSDAELRLIRASGFDSCLIKPVAEDELVGALTQLRASEAHGALRPDLGSEGSEHNKKELQVHDARRALELAGGNEALAADLFNMLMSELEEQLGVLSDESVTADALREIAHKLRASARYCAAPTLEQRATTLEQAIATGAGRAEIDTARQRLREAIGDLLNIRETASFHHPASR